MAGNFLLKVNKKRDDKPGSRSVYYETKTFEEAVEALNEELGDGKVIQAELEYPYDFGPSGVIEAPVDKLWPLH